MIDDEPKRDYKPGFYDTIDSICFWKTVRLCLKERFLRCFHHIISKTLYLDQLEEFLEEIGSVSLPIGYNAYLYGSAAYSIGVSKCPVLFFGQNGGHLSSSVHG